MTFCDGEITVKVDASARAAEAKEEVATSEEVTSVHAVKPSTSQPSRSSSVTSSGSTQSSSVTSSALRGQQPSFYAVVNRDVIEFYAVVSSDVIEAYTRSSAVTSPKVLRGVELVLKVSFDLPVKPLATIHANFV